MSHKVFFTPSAEKDFVWLVERDKALAKRVLDELEQMSEGHDPRLFPHVKPMCDRGQAPGWYRLALYPTGLRVVFSLHQKGIEVHRFDVLNGGFLHIIVERLGFHSYVYNGGLDRIYKVLHNEK